MDISDILFQIIAESYPEVSRIEWLQFANLVKPDQFSEYTNVKDLMIHTLLKSPYISCILAPKYLDFGVTENHRIEMPIKKTCYIKDKKDAAKIKPTVIAQGVHVDIDALYIVNYPTGTRFHLNGIDELVGTVDPSDQKLRDLFALARDLHRYRNSPEDAAFVMQRLDNAPSQQYDPEQLKKVAALAVKSKPIEMNINQAKFIRDFFQLKTAIRTIPLFTYYAMMQELRVVPHAIYAFFSNDPKSMNKVNAYREYHRAREELERTNNRMMNEELLNVGLIKTAAKQLGLTYDRLTFTKPLVMRSIDPTQHEAVIARFNLLKSIMTAIDNNGCEHKQYPLSRILLNRDLWFGEVTDKHVLCRECNLPLCCIHRAGDIKQSIYAIRTSNYELCRYCGEILNELFSDDTADEILDPEFRSLVWSRVQAMKNHVRRTATAFNRINDARLVDLIAAPLYEHYIAIEKMRTLDANTKHIYEQLYANIYALVGYMAMGYNVRNVNTFAELLPQVRIINGVELNVTKYDDNKIKGVVVGATYEIGNRLRKVQTVEEFNDYSTEVNNTPLMQFCISGNLRSVDRVLAGPDVAAFKRANPNEMEFVRAHINKLPEWYQAYATWWTGDPYVQTTEALARYKANVEHDVLRSGYRYTGHFVLPYKTHQFFFEGPTDLTAHYGLDGKRLTKAGKITTGSIARQWEAALKAGIGYRPSLINAESQKVRLAMRQRTYHILFIERYTQVCPSADSDAILHDFKSGPKCKLCGATNAEITTSLNYYQKYEAKYMRIKVIPDRSFIGETVKPTPRKPLKEYGDELTQLKSNIARLSQDMQVSHIRWEQLGNFEGRKASETIDLFSNINADTPKPNYGITRWMRVNAYLRETVQMARYAANFIKNGAGIKIQPVYNYLISHNNSTSLTDATIDKISKRMDNNYPAVDEQDLQKSIDGMIGAIVASLLLIRKDDAALGKLISDYILQMDYYTAKYEKLDFIERVSNEGDDYADAQEEYVTINKKIAEDPFYQDFEFDAPEDNIAPRD